jgi:hypothetical protein
MTESIEISAELKKWGELAGYKLAHGTNPNDGVAVFSASLGETRILIRRNNTGWFVITDSDRMGPEQFILATPSMATVERYFFGKFGLAIRSLRNLPRVRVPVSAEKLSPGFRLETRIFDGVERWALIALDDSTVAVGSTDQVTGTAELVRLSLYLSSTIDEIIASVLDPDGKPLFQPR